MSGSPNRTGPPPESPPASGLMVRYGKFLIVGLTGVVVNLIVFVLVLDAIHPGDLAALIALSTRLKGGAQFAALDLIAASCGAFVVATLWNFTLNNRWTFRSRIGHRHPVGRRMQFYYLVSLGSLAVNEVVLYVLDPHFAPIAAQGVGIIAGSVVGFVGNQEITFREAIPLAPPKGPADG